jgi:hypothetical protein
MKKFATLAGSAALLLSMAAPAFAWWNDELTVENVGTSVSTSAYTVANTGDNSVHGMFVKVE